MSIIIPEGSIEVQTGLWAYWRSSSWNGVDTSSYELYSADGYCFWSMSDASNYDEEGNLKPASERVYARVCYTTCKTVEAINAEFISVPIEEGFEIVSVSDNPVTE